MVITLSIQQHIIRRPAAKLLIMRDTCTNEMKGNGFKMSVLNCWNTCSLFLQLCLKWSLWLVVSVLIINIC